MTEPIHEPEPVDPGHDTGVDPAPDEETSADEVDDGRDEIDSSNLVPKTLVTAVDLESEDDEDDEDDAVDRAERLDEPERRVAPEQPWIASDMP
jgi:hypothetical protein